MYKVIFLDDELITVRMLESAIDWQRYQVVPCGMANDGEEGLELFRDIEPDIVIADIRMPKMNGIEFARAIRKTGKRVKILLLSAYAEFEYAQTALTYQISDYLLKPLDEDKLEAAIGRLVHELDQDNTLSSTVENYQLEQAEKQLQQFVLQRLGGMDTEISIPIPGEIQATFGQADTFVRVLRVMETREFQTITDVEGIRLFFKDRLGSHTAVVSISSTELIILTNNLDLQRQLEDILSTLRLRGQPVIIGLSQIARPFNLAQAYRQAETALYECFCGGREWGIYTAEPVFSNELPIKLAEFEHPIAELVEQGKSSDLIESLQSNFSGLTGRWVHPAFLYDFAFDFLNWVKISVTKQYPSKSLTNLVTVDRNQLRTYATKEILLEYLCQHLQTIGEAVHDLLAENPGYYIVQRAKNYTREHYATKKFSLQDVADYVGLSKNHLSRVFHETTGVKFWDYVTQLRIERAKELLKESSRSNYEISREIGYESEFYFSKVFKKIVGIAAQEFRRL